MELVTAAQMREIEQAAIESGAATGLELMERAGRGVVKAILAKWPKLAASPGRAIVLCGPGNNGGDGFVVARLLVDKGWAVDVYLYGDEQNLPPDAAQNCIRWRQIGDVQPWSRLTFSSFYHEDVDIIVDAVFGIGLKRGLSEDVAQVADWLVHGDINNEWGIYYDLTDRVVAIDTPSGLCADSGVPIGETTHFQAALTVTFGYPKPGHFLSMGPGACGELVIADIGLRHWDLYADLALLDRDELNVDLKYVVERWGNHKFDHGHALVIAGGVGRGGAARMAARGALRIGAGLVTVGTPPAALIENAAQLNAVMLTRIADAADLAKVLTDERINAILLGPGMGVGARTREMVAAACDNAGKRSVVLDADALTSFRDAPSDLFALTCGARCVLTPHKGEFARLFPDLSAKLNAPLTNAPFYSDVDAARDASARAGCVVLLKGAATAIAQPNGVVNVAAAVYERSTPWLGTAGAGDVLAGFITGLMARGFDPEDAASLAAYLHQECALSFGPGLIAEDLPEELPKVMRSLI